MPLLSDTMKEGVIAEWHVKVGDKIKSDDVIAEVETDKATMEVIPYVEGTVLYIGPKKGEAAKVNDIIAIVGKAGEDYKPLLDQAGADAKETSGKPSSGAEDKKSADEEQSPKPATDKKALEEAEKNTTVIRMPLLSDTMKEGKIVEWNKKVGDKVASDDVLAEVETDKATMEVIGYAEGTLLYIGVEKGQSAKVNDIIAIVGKEGTNIQPLLDVEKASGTREKSGKEEQEEAAESAKQASSSQEAEAPAAGSADGRVKASPLARRLAEEKGIPLDQIQGSGDGGRIIKRDVDNFVPQAPAAAKTAAQGVQPFAAAGQEGHQDTPVSQMRKTIARRLSESKFTAPHFYLTIEVNMDNAIQTRKTMNEISPVKISFNDMIIKAAATALRQHPEVNSSWIPAGQHGEGDVIRTYQHIHIGSAVAIDEGLIVPVIRFADQKTLSQIASEAKTLYDKAKNKKLQPQDFSGNTFTISNLGMMGIDEFTAIINPPDACILAVGSIKETVVVKEGEFKVANIMKLTLSSDHRVVDGAVGARFLQTLKIFIENPAAMLV
jgi:pyruvate dehydrogenase E2 component (dihydrolipoamide acetyltransferase)